MSCYCFLVLSYKIRDKFLNEITAKYNFFKGFNNIDLFACKSVAAFVFEILNQRHNYVI